MDIMRPSYIAPHQTSCPYVCLFVCLSLKDKKKHRKTKIGVNVPQGMQLCHKFSENNVGLYFTGSLSAHTAHHAGMTFTQNAIGRHCASHNLLLRLRHKCVLIDLLIKSELLTEIENKYVISAYVRAVAVDGQSNSMSALSRHLRYTLFISQTVSIRNYCDN